MSKFNSINAKSLTAGTWVVHYENTLSSAATAVTVSGLNGDVDEDYLVVTRLISNGTNVSGAMYPNNDTTAANHGYQRIYAVSGNTTGANRATSTAGFVMATPGGSGKSGFGVYRVHAKSGYLRMMTSEHVTDITNLTVGGFLQLSGVWNNTADNITSFVFTASAANGFGIGSYFLVMKKVKSSSTISAFNSVSVPVGKLTADTFETVFETTLGAAATDVTITGLAGNTDVLYELEVFLTYGASSGTAFQRVRLNNDSIAHYGYQQIKTINTTLSGLASATETGWSLCHTGLASTSEVLFASVMFYAKSGFLRPGVATWVEKVNGATIGATGAYGLTWNDTATEVTSITLAGSVANAHGIGTFYRLKALKRKT
jgi:hypothetical protein